MSYNTVQRAASSPKGPAGGNLIIPSQGNMLQLDYDSPCSRRMLEPLLTRLTDLELIDGDDAVLTTNSPGGKGTHAYIRLTRGLSLAQRLVLQLFGGSDPIREVLSLSREIGPADDDYATPESCLFETPEEEKRVREWWTRTAETKSA